MIPTKGQLAAAIDCTGMPSLHTLPQRQNGGHLADNIFKIIFLELFYFDSNFTEICSQESNQQQQYQ